MPGYIGVVESAESGVKIAKKLGFPIIVKAAAGGGGRGMRIVRTPQDMYEAFISASNEAKNCFSDARIFIEKYIEDPRHIEVQVLADKHGNVVCLGERECSIQRHHQKIIEEAPSPFITEKVRAKLFKDSLKLAKAIKYHSAGTIEFIMDAKQNFYFMEMNTRIQVEHCVTELVYDVDLIEQMIRIAAGAKLELQQKSLVPSGWAIECRICAEDPSRGFLPSSGRITHYKEPTRSKGVRVDSGVAEGGEVSMFYDQMISKLCTYAPTRTEAISIMVEVLGEYVISGIAHNISFLQAIMQHPRFISGDISTNFIAHEYPDGFLGAEITSDMTKVFIGVAVHVFLEESMRSASIAKNPEEQRKTIGSRWIVNIDNKEFFYIVSKQVSGGYKIRYENSAIYTQSDWVIGSGLFRGSISGQLVAVGVKPTIHGYKFTYAGRSSVASVRSPRVSELEQFMLPKNKEGMFRPEIEAPLAGKIMKIFVKEGDEVKAGSKLIVIEAMKMENVIIANNHARVRSVKVQEGRDANCGETLIELEKL